MSTNKTYVIAIDGPAGSGKSTIARELGKILGIRYLDSGALYRALTYYLWRLYNEEKTLEEFPVWVECKSKEGMEIWKNAEISVIFGDNEENQIFLNGENVTAIIRTPEITEKTKYIANQRPYRDFINQKLRELAHTQSLVLDGRDIGTEVFPDTPHKFFLTASPEERARRRYNEMLEKNMDITWEEVYQDLIRRDESDTNRKIAPLRMAKDAILIDTDGLSKNIVINKILSKLGSF